MTERKEVRNIHDRIREEYAYLQKAKAGLDTSANVTTTFNIEPEDYMQFIALGGRPWLRKELTEVVVDDSTEGIMGNLYKVYDIKRRTQRQRYCNGVITLPTHLFMVYRTLGGVAWLRHLINKHRLSDEALVAHFKKHPSKSIVGNEYLAELEAKLKEQNA